MTDQGQDPENRPENQPENMPHHHHDFDADAVCVQCGMVNEEGTLYCHNCGNNLREQRRLRLEAETLLLHQGDKTQRRQWIIGILGTLGLIVVLIAGLRANQIAEWLLEVQEPNPDDPRVLWSPPQNDRYDQMFEELREAAITPDHLADMVYQPTSDFPQQGRLVLFYGEDPVGVAQVERYSNLVLMVGLLFTGEEIRGRAQLQGEWLVMDFSQGALRQGRQYTAAAGVVQQDGEGAFLGYGQRDGSDATYVFKAYLIAEAPA